MELDRAVDQGKRLTLAIYIPAVFAWLLPSHRRIFFFETLLLPPLPQGPFRRPMDAGIGIVLVEGEQLVDQRLPVLCRESLFSILSQRQDQRPPLRRFGMEQYGVHQLLPLGGCGLGVGVDPVEFSDNQLRIGTQWIQPVDDEAPQPGVGTVPQQGSDFLCFPHANQGYCGPSLTFRQAILHHL